MHPIGFYDCCECWGECVTIQGYDTCSCYAKYNDGDCEHCSCWTGGVECEHCGCDDFSCEGVLEQCQNRY